MDSTPYWAFISGLTKRQPMVVSKISACRPKASALLPMTKGARVMLSTPPASISSASPDLMARAAMPVASMPEPQRRFTVAPGMPSGSPASSEAMRATLRLSSPAWLAQPRMTSSSAPQLRRGWRAIRARIGTAARSSARTAARAPA